MSVRQGLPDDYADLYQREAGRLWRAVYGFAQEREIASDAVAEAFAQCIRRSKDVRSPARWIWRAAFRIAAGELKERSRFGELEREPTYELPEPEGPVLQALRALPPQQRAAVVLMHFADLDARSAGAVLGCSMATVRVHASRGRKRLRKLLEEGDG